MTPGGALRAREPTPGPGAGEEGAFRRRGARGRRSRDAAERGRASGARGGAAPALETDSETLGRGGLSDRPAGSAAAEWPTGAPTPGRPAGAGEMNGFSTEEDSREGPPAAPAAAPGYGQSCCLIEDGERCVRPAGNASFSKRVQKSISQKKLKLDIDKSVRHLYICDFHKNFIQSVRNKRKRKTSDDGGDSPEHDTDIPEVDLFQLQVNTLRRYKRHYKLQTRPGFNKAQLAETVSRHFRNIPVNEKETLAYFIYMVKSNKSRLDQKSEGGKQLE